MSIRRLTSERVILDFSERDSVRNSDETRIREQKSEFNNRFHSPSAGQVGDRFGNIGDLHVEDILRELAI